MMIGQHLIDEVISHGNRYRPSVQLSSMHQADTCMEKPQRLQGLHYAFILLHRNHSISMFPSVATSWSAWTCGMLSSFGMPQSVWYRKDNTLDLNVATCFDNTCSCGQITLIIDHTVQEKFCSR